MKTVTLLLALLSFSLSANVIKVTLSDTDSFEKFKAHGKRTGEMVVRNGVMYNNVSCQFEVIDVSEGITCYEMPFPQNLVDRLKCSDHCTVEMVNPIK